MKVPKGVLSGLEELQKLACIDGSSRHGNIAQELRNLKQPRKLGITHLRIKDWEALCATIESLVHLRTMMLTTINTSEFLHSKFITSPPTLLEKLYLKGALERIPSWITKLNSIVGFYLRWSRIKEDPMEIFKEVHSLEELVLIDAYNSEKLHFSSEGFPKLKLLNMYETKNLKSISIEIGALPVLDRLLIGLAPQMKQMPFGIQTLKSLTSLTFIDMPEEIVNGTKYRFEVYFYSKVDGQWEISTVFEKARRRHA